MSCPPQDQDAGRPFDLSMAGAGGFVGSLESFSVPRHHPAALQEPLALSPQAAGWTSSVVLQRLMGDISGFGASAVLYVSQCIVGDIECTRGPMLWLTGQRPSVENGMFTFA